MRPNLAKLLVGLILWVSACGAWCDEVIVIGHAGVPKTDRSTVQRLYTGRAVSIGQLAIEPVNLPSGHPVRDDFLLAFLEQNDQQYMGYWLVRRYVGKGVPPAELGSVEEVIKYVQGTPGAIGYLPASKLPRGANVIFRR